MGRAKIAVSMTTTRRNIKTAAALERPSWLALRGLYPNGQPGQKLFHGLLNGIGLVRDTGPDIFKPLLDILPEDSNQQHTDQNNQNSDNQGRNTALILHQGAVFERSQEALSFTASLVMNFFMMNTPLKF